MLVASVAGIYFRCRCSRGSVHYILSIGLIRQVLACWAIWARRSMWRGNVTVLGSSGLEQDLSQWDLAGSGCLWPGHDLPLWVQRLPQLLLLYEQILWHIGLSNCQVKYNLDAVLQIVVVLVSEVLSACWAVQCLNVWFPVRITENTIVFYLEHFFFIWEMQVGCRLFILMVSKYPRRTLWPTSVCIVWELK